MVRTWFASTLVVTDAAIYAQTTQLTTQLLHALATRQVLRYGQRERAVWPMISLASELY